MISFSPHLTQRTKTHYYIAAAIWESFIFYLSAQPVLPSPDTFLLDFAFKKMAHMFVYFILFWLIYKAIQFDVKHPVKLSLLAFCFTVILAFSDEFHQSFIPGRTPTTKDVLFDSLGMVVAWLSLNKYV